MGAHGMINYVDARTSWMDGLVRDAAAQGAGQVVIIASGYCTRAYRLHQPGVKACAPLTLTLDPAGFQATACARTACISPASRYAPSMN